MVNRIGCVKASHTPTRKCNKSTLNGNSLTEAQSQSKNTCETLHGTNHRHRDRRAGRCSGRCCPETQLTEVSPLGTAMKHSTRLKRTQNGAAAFLTTAHWGSRPQRTVSEERSGSPGCHNVKSIFSSILNCPCHCSLALMVQKRWLVRLLGPPQTEAASHCTVRSLHLPLLILKSQFHPRMFPMNSKNYVLCNFDPRYTPFNIW